MLDHYLDLLDGKFEDKQDGASKVIHLARLGSQSAFDAILERYYERTSSNRRNLMVDPASALLAACDLGSKFQDKTRFWEALTSIFGEKVNLRSSIPGIGWRAFENNVDASYIKTFDQYIAPLLPKLVFVNDENNLCDDDFKAEYPPTTPSSLIFFRGMSFLNGDDINNLYVLNPDYLLQPFIFYKNFTKELADEIIADGADSLTKKQLEMFFLIFRREKVESISGERIGKNFWQIEQIREILETCLKCTEKKSYGGERHLGYMHLYFPSTPSLDLTYAGKHILGALCALSEVLYECAQKFDIASDTDLDFDLIHALKHHDDDSPDDLYIQVPRYIDNLSLMYEDSKKLISKHPELEMFKKLYRTTYPQHRKFWNPNDWLHSS